MGSDNHFPWKEIDSVQEEDHKTLDTVCRLHCSSGIDRLRVRQRRGGARLPRAAPLCGLRAFWGERLGRGGRTGDEGRWVSWGGERRRR
ncbi:hypothetical protein AAC387_Pa02g0286 [Persea americana]